MKNSSMTTVNDKTVKAVKDNTDWTKVYAQCDEDIQRNISTDPDAQQLQNAVYKKSANSQR